jgi:regulator of protease activity HflC (stomatin/prohibitin superfamily)
MTTPEIQQEIERTRERLGETVDELAAKADVRARARAKGAEMKARTQGKAIEVKARAQGKAAEMKGKAMHVSGQVRRSQAVQRRWPVAAAAAGVILVGSLVVWRRRKT